MALEIVHTERSYVVVDNEEGRWSSQPLYDSYLNARKFALVWKQAAKFWRWRWYQHWETMTRCLAKLQENTNEPQT